jgi:hypothetical protein
MSILNEQELCEASGYIKIYDNFKQQLEAVCICPRY